MSEFEPQNQQPCLKEVVKEKPSFLKTYRDANFFSKITFHYANPFIRSINSNNNQMKEEILLDME